MLECQALDEVQVVTVDQVECSGHLAVGGPHVSDQAQVPAGQGASEGVAGTPAGYEMITVPTNPVTETLLRIIEQQQQTIAELQSALKRSKQQVQTLLGNGSTKIFNDLFIRLTV